LASVTSHWNCGLPDDVPAVTSAVQTFSVPSLPVVVASVTGLLTDPRVTLGMMMSGLL
jgi:hypothetical protein